MLSINDSGDLGGIQNHTHHTSPETTYRALQRALSQIKEAYKNPAWGARGLNGFVSNPRQAKAAAPAAFEQLVKVLDEALDAMQMFEAAHDPNPVHTAYLLRNSVFSDAFCLSLFIIDGARKKEEGEGAAKLPLFEEVLKTTTERMAGKIIEELGARDADDLAEWMRKVASDLGDLDTESIHFSVFRLASIASSLKLMGEVMAAPGHRFRSQVGEWLKERARDKEHASDLLDELERPPSLGRAKLPQVPVEEPLTDTENEVSLAVASPPPSPKPAVTKEIPKGGLLDDIEGIEEVGKDDTRRGPVRSGNVDKPRQKDAFTLKQEAKAAAQEAKLKARGLKTNDQLGKTKHEQKRAADRAKKK